MADGFRVNLGALEQASAGIDDTLTQLSERKAYFDDLPEAGK